MKKMNTVNRSRLASCVRMTWMMWMMWAMSNLLQHVDGECLPPVASADSTVNAPQLQSKSIEFIANPNPKNSYDTRLLSVTIKWWTVSNRTLSWAGIGDDPACSPFILTSNGSIAAGGWSYSASDDCFVVIRAKYSWPEALFNPSCNRLFSTSEDASTTTVNFDIIAKFNETYVSTDPGSNITRLKTVASKLPVTLTFPKDVKLIATAAIRIEVAADIINQNVSGAGPYHIDFVTYHNQSFTLSDPSVEFSGKSTPLYTAVTQIRKEYGDVNLYTTWSLAITTAPTACFLDGIYRVTFKVQWAGREEDNPLPANATITVALKIQAQPLCRALVADDLIITPQVKVVDDCVVLRVCLCLAIVILIGLFLSGCICGCAGGIGSMKVKRKFSLMKRSDDYTYKPSSTV